MFCGATALLLASGQVAAFFQDKLQLQFSEQLSYDSNVFRASSGRDPTTFINSSEKADILKTTRIGLAFDVPVSRQRFQASYGKSSTRYNRFTDRDFDGHDERAAWLWQVGNNLSGQLGYTKVLGLASFNNFQTRVANPLTTTQTFANATYLLGARWRVQAGLNRVVAENGELSRQIQNFESNSPDIAISYVSPASNSIGFHVGLDDGRFPNRQLVAGSLFDNAYLQRTAGPVLDWQLTGHSRLGLRYDQITRNYAQLSQRNFDGSGYRISYDWTPTGKLVLSGVARREISALEDIRTSFVMAQGYTFRPTWTVTSKITLGAVIDYTVRDYLGDPGLVLGSAPARRDTSKLASLTATYIPMRQITLTLSATHETRASTVPLGDFSDNLYSLNAQFAF